ncbi:MAG: hypothetical protein ACI8XO_002458 [Verrucomicrobiales bacterium]
MATKLFKTYAANAPRGTFPQQTSTHQGLYCMTPEGDYLSGKFARQTNGGARDTITSGLANWKEMVRKSNANPKPVPTDKLELFGGEVIQKGGLKLEVAYRDLPRGDVERPGDTRFPNPYNLGWYDLTPEEAKTFVTGSKSKAAIPDQVFKKIARECLKDAVRGQMSNWKDADIKDGQLFTSLAAESGSKQTYQLSGSAEMDSGELTFSPKLHGTLTFDQATGEFTDFRLIAAGQRTGKAGANGRETDLGPAPMAIALTMYRK